MATKQKKKAFTVGSLVMLQKFKEGVPRKVGAIRCSFGKGKWEVQWRDPAVDALQPPFSGPVTPQNSKSLTAYIAPESEDDDDNDSSSDDDNAESEDHPDNVADGNVDIDDDSPEALARRRADKLEKFIKLHKSRIGNVVLVPDNRSKSAPPMVTVSLNCVTLETDLP